MVTPATAGPFDLGTVVVRVALFVEPETAQVRAVSDPIPHVFGGALLSIRSVDLEARPQELHPQPDQLRSARPPAGPSSAAAATRPTRRPSAPSPVSAPFQASGCEKLGFRPKLFTRLFGGRKATQRAQHPKFRAVLVAREGDANISRAAVTLPHSQFLDQGHIGTVCTRVQLAADDCPERSIYGYARAKTPLLDDEAGGAGLPGLLRPRTTGPARRPPRPGQRAAARGDQRRQGADKNVFYPVPDVPVSKFVLTMKGGKRGLLVNSRDLCAHPSSRS